MPRRPTILSRGAREEIERYGSDAWAGFQEAIYASPWRDRLPDGGSPAGYSLGPAYGPENESQWHAAVEHWEESIHSGGLWDHDEALRHAPVRRVARAVQQRRYDEDSIGRWVESRPTRMTRRQLEVYYAYWVDKRSQTQIARALGLSHHTVRDLVRGIRSSARSAV